MYRPKTLRWIFLTKTDVVRQTLRLPLTALGRLLSVTGSFSRPEAIFRFYLSRVYITSQNPRRTLAFSTQNPLCRLTRLGHSRSHCLRLGRYLLIIWAAMQVLQRASGSRPIWPMHSIMKPRLQTTTQTFRSTTHTLKSQRSIRLLVLLMVQRC